MGITFLDHSVVNIFILVIKICLQCVPTVLAAWWQDELDEEFQQRLAEHKEAAVSRTEKKRAKRYSSAFILLERVLFSVG